MVGTTKPRRRTARRAKASTAGLVCLGVLSVLFAGLVLTALLPEDPSAGKPAKVNASAGRHERGGPAGRAAPWGKLESIPIALSVPEELAARSPAVEPRSALLVRLHVGPGADLAALTDYWCPGGRARDLRPLLASVMKVPGGGWLDIAQLLPEFARKRLYTYPHAGDQSANHNCYWTALNFFNDQPDELLGDLGIAARCLRQDYVPVMGEQKFGDVILLKPSPAAAVHACVLIAEDIVFTKNGPGLAAPWVLMRLPEVMTGYAAGRPLQVQVYRRKVGV